MLYVLFWAMFTLPMLLQGWLAWQDSMLTVRQMQMFRYVYQGIPFLWNMAMWADVFLGNVFLSWLVVTYHDQWSLGQVVGCILAGSITSCNLLQNSLGRDSFDAHVQGRHPMSAGRIHVIFMSVLVGGVFLFFFASTPTLLAMLVVDTLLILHVTFVVQVPLKVKRPVWFPENERLDHKTLVVISGTIMSLLGLTVVSLSWF